MTVLIVLAVFYLAVLLLKNLTFTTQRAKDALPLVINVVVVAGLVLALLVGFGVLVVPALER